MLETVLYIPFWFELTATIVYAVSGAMSASRAQYDLLGTIVVATIVGLFGGVMRDVLLQDYGIYAFQRPQLMIACVITGIVVFYFGRLISFFDPITEMVDTVGIGLWAIVGTGKALSAGLGIVPAVVMGLLTAIGGGVVRDVLMNRPVAAFQPSSYYGTAVLLGSIVFAFMRTYNVLDQWSAIICALLVIAIRLGSVTFGWQTRPSRDLTVPMADALAKPVRALKGRDRLSELVEEAEAVGAASQGFHSS
ncbi:MAG: TRIC cation channel family protein [Eggerthellaceae bacterium]|nr:TRIC cation channel family protein [Eggerthellaceae bacterium]